MKVISKEILFQVIDGMISRSVLYGKVNVIEVSALTKLKEFVNSGECDNTIDVHDLYDIYDAEMQEIIQAEED